MNKSASTNFLMKTAALALLTPFIFGQSNSKKPIAFNRSWWEPLSQDERWNFIYGFTDCGKAIQSGLNMQQYDQFISKHVDSKPDSVPQSIRVAPQKVKLLKSLPGGEVWHEKHGFLNGDFWGLDYRDKRTFVEGFLACEERSASLPSVDRYVLQIDRHYANPKRHLDKIADILEPLLPAKISPETR